MAEKVDKKSKIYSIDWPYPPTLFAITFTTILCSISNNSWILRFNSLQPLILLHLK